MADVKRLAMMMKELDDQLVNCMRCGMCQAVCPVFKQTGRETDVTRGKLALLDGLASEMFTEPEKVNKLINKCLMCGTCEANCPSGVKVTDIFFKARAILTGYFGMSSVQRLAFQKLLTNPTLFNSLVSVASKFQGLFTKEANETLGTSCARFQAPLVGDRHFKKLAQTPFHADVPKRMTKPGASGVTVAFYPGCVVDKMFPEVGHACLKVFDYHGVGVFMPENMACCGIPGLSSGEHEGFEELVRENLDLFDGVEFDYLVTPCATCASTIKKLWPEYSRPYDKRRALQLAPKVMDITQFLVDVVGVKAVDKQAGIPAVTWHDPCHLRNSMGVTTQPRTLLAATKTYEYVEMADAASCCGCGGSFTVKFPEMSTAIGEAKAQNVIDSQANVVATGCPACMMQLSDQLSRKGAKTPVRHAVELYAETLSS
ncbi:(Fe-S)-binding protein [Desulfovibrio inopinatus]|uniref:(Fe-S)-binding protein n=1 Tax=Desulfovibrio inopinatus TaxID=102109 RepID=UPI00041EDBEE|nr:(Fe-S)-binding protein [Desulfovibrio inopinatus]